jgi:hypothetical protein
MSLYDKIKSIYPEIEDKEFIPVAGTIHLRNDSDGNGDYIAKWEHPTLAQPTEEQLAAVTQ